jgi:hypothetical protein
VVNDDTDGTRVISYGALRRARGDRKAEGDDVTATTSNRTLQDVLDSVPNLVDFLYSNRKGSVLKDAVLRQPTEFVAPEFTTWRDEQRAWREGIAFYDQSFHMTTTYLRGPDAQKLISSLAVNSFETFGVGRSRHTVMCSPEGYLIGDGTAEIQKLIIAREYIGREVLDR